MDIQDPRIVFSAYLHVFIESIASAAGVLLMALVTYRILPVHFARTPRFYA